MILRFILIAFNSFSHSLPIHTHSVCLFRCDDDGGFSLLSFIAIMHALYHMNRYGRDCQRQQQQQRVCGYLPAES